MYLIIIIIIIFVFCPFRAALTAYGGSRARLFSRCRSTPQPQQRQIRAASVTHTTVHGNAESLTHWARPGIEHTTSWFLVRFVSTAPPWELLFKKSFNSFGAVGCYRHCHCSGLGHCKRQEIVQHNFIFVKKQIKTTQDINCGYVFMYVWKSRERSTQISGTDDLREMRLDGVKGEKEDSLL